ncbi:membrane associated rhomboid family serine protease [Actinomadura pelletieri DSM 43383]|uniref:Membrane associated rhomboid family serine protease n=1 Tax=Actinomadura pelletieri DSM 43383 TaxID=1120940 RepID=A0A495QYP9_9ACTN|nr:rhomboid family intramembrane serine protease [Actinomadura pelletieri]RKS79250.1 membrane associated rhomboid family serine protease [Actinomadura pelletieri DSM 43383]
MSTEQSHPSETSVPTCYRHPGRETYVRCTRCDRYICPECMRDAAVGHQCVECVREGNRGVRTAVPRTPVGARAAASTTPVVTYTLIGACVAAYLAELASWNVVREFMMLGRAILPDGEVGGVAEGEWYRLFTAMFLHQRGGTFGVTHILFNMWLLWAVGPALEQVLGRWRFLALYLLSGLGGSVLLYMVGAPQSSAVGASGAIFGLLGAYFVLGRALGRPVGSIVFLLGINLVITFSVPNISWEGHVGGLVIGAALAAAYGYAPSARRNLFHIGAPVLAFALMTALVLLRTAELNPTF